MGLDLFSLTGKVALVTGGAQGLGRMITEALLHAGAEVMITSRKSEVLAAAVSELSEIGPCDGVTADLSSAEAAVSLAETFRSKKGACHILINNAGRSFGAPIENFPDSAWTSVMSVNVQAPFALIREMLPTLKSSATPDEPSRIINIGSVAGLKTEKLQAYSYAASKAAIHMLTRDLAGDLAGDSITVNTLAPGFFPTRMTKHLREGDVPSPELANHIPLGRFGRPEEIGGSIVYLCSRAGAYLTGSLLTVDGGITGCG